MSHHGLQKALVVALHDPRFVERIHEDPDGALAEFDLTSEERAQLRAVDRRAFTIDAMRSRRVLKAVAAELPASLTIALARTRRFATAEQFFASSQFRRAIRDDQPLVFALADYLDQVAQELGSSLLSGVIAIERARAQCRRPSPTRPGLQLAPGVALVASTAGAMAALHAAESALFQATLVPHMALCEDPAPLDFEHLVDDTPVWMVVAARAAEVVIEPVDQPLFAVLSAIDRASHNRALDRPAMAGILAEVGLRVPDPGRLTDELCAAGYLTLERSDG